MKAVRIHAYGGIDQLLYEDAPDPNISSPGEVIVELKAASLNHIDLWNRRGRTGIQLDFPHILGADGAGIVIETGREVDNVRPGDAVCLYPASGCGQCEFCRTDRDFMCIRVRVLGERLPGTYAEYVKIQARNCFPIPAGFSFEEAAAFPLVHITVWRMLVINGGLQPGDRVLILGVGGGVASAALLLALRMGARVMVTSGSDEKLEKARALGAEHGINHHATDFAKEARQWTGKRGVDLVVDCAGGEGWPKSLAALAKGGRLVTCGATAGPCAPTDIRRVFWNQLKIFGSTLGSRADFQQALDFANATGTKPIVDRAFDLTEARAAQQRLEAGKQFGKIVLRIGKASESVV